MSTHSPEQALPALPSRLEPKLRKPPPKVRAAIEALVTGQVRTITAAANASATAVDVNAWGFSSDGRN